MQDLPKADDLVSAVAAFLRQDIAPLVPGAAGFQLRVAINALDLVARQLVCADAADVAENARLQALLGRSGSLDALNRALAEAIAGGTLDLSTPGLLDHLWSTTLAKLAVDQPSYAAYKQELGL